MAQVGVWLRFSFRLDLRRDLAWHQELLPIQRLMRVTVQLQLVLPRQTQSCLHALA